MINFKQFFTKKYFAFLILFIFFCVNYLNILIIVNNNFKLPKCTLNHNCNRKTIQNFNSNSTIGIHWNPNFKMKQIRRNEIEIVIGISTIKRENTTYLNRMLESLFLAIDNNKENVLVVLLIAEVYLTEIISV